MASVQFGGELLRFKLSYNQRVNVALNQSELVFTALQVLARSDPDGLSAVVFGGSLACNGEDIVTADLASDDMYCVIGDTDTWYNVTVPDGFEPVTVTHDEHGNAQIIFAAEFAAAKNGELLEMINTELTARLASIDDVSGGNAAYTGNVGAAYYSGIEQDFDVIIPEVSGLTMSSNYIAVGGVVLGMVTEFKPSKLSDRVVSKALDGSVYIQTLGIGSQQAATKVFARTMTAKDALEAAACEGAPCVVAYNGTTYVGYIEGDIEWTFAVGNRAAEGSFALLIPVS